jgi:hypothetical protein
MTEPTLVERIHAAVAALDEPGVARLTDELIAEIRQRRGSFPVDDARAVMQALRRKRYFAHMQRVGDELLQAGEQAPEVRRQYAQALIDGGQLSLAIPLLRQLVTDTEGGSERENLEARGLLGRAFKQRYVNLAATGAPTDEAALEQAIRHYGDAFELSGQHSFWHGINLVALGKRAAADRVAVPGAPDPDALARGILALLDRKGAAMDAWDLAIGLEAVLAVGTPEEAMRWAHGYTAHPGADAFELASTLRQLEEVWRLDPGSPMGAAVLPLLQSALLQRQDGFLRLEPAELKKSSRALEKVFGHDFFVSLDWYKRGLERARGVARIGREVAQGDGTGFLVRGRDLHERYGDELLLLTNAHVISTDERETGSIHPAEAVVTFAALGESGQAVEEFTVDEEILWYSPSDRLDTTVVRLKRPVGGVEPYPVFDAPPRRDEKQRVYIIGHPAGGGLSFSLHDNHLLDFDDRLLHYRAPTEPGSSGSPIFNSQWRLIGIHHAGGEGMQRLNGQPGTYPANEGIRIKAIRQALADLPG